MLVVPRGEDFCVDARLRRVASSTARRAVHPRGEAEARAKPRPFQLIRMIEYLYRVYLIGTPLEELDVDLIGGLARQ